MFTFNMYLYLGLHGCKRKKNVQKGVRDKANLILYFNAIKDKQK